MERANRGEIGTIEHGFRKTVRLKQRQWEALKQKQREGIQKRFANKKVGRLSNKTSGYDGFRVADHTSCDYK